MPVNRRSVLQWVAASPVTVAGSVWSANARAIATSVCHRLHFVLTFSNPLNTPLYRQTFWFYLPAATTATQKLKDVRVSMPHLLYEDALSHRILQLQFDEVAPLAQRIVTLAVDVELQRQPEPQELPDRAVWLVAERYIEVDDPDVGALARELNTSEPVLTARAIYDWVIQNLTYAGYLADDFGARWALQNRRGDCTEFADLAVALSRACGIPARMVGGYVTNRDAAPKPADYHNWAEIYLDGTWRLLDCQKRRWLSQEDEYIAFRIYRDSVISPIGNVNRYRMGGDLLVTF